MNLRRAVATAKILWPFPFYMPIKRAAQLVGNRFSGKPVASVLADGERERWQYWAGYIANSSGFWVPIVHDGTARYRWIPGHSMSMFGRELDDTTPSVLVGRLSVWAAYRKLHAYEIDHNTRLRVIYRRTASQWARFVSTAARSLIIGPKSIKNIHTQAVANQPRQSELDAFAERIAQNDAGKSQFPTVDFTVKPADVSYNWKSDDPSRQSVYRKAGWKAVPPSRHPELKPFHAKKRIVWGESVLMEIPMATYREMQKADFDLAQDMIHRLPAERVVAFELQNYGRKKR